MLVANSSLFWSVVVGGLFHRRMLVKRWRNKILHWFSVFVSARIECDFRTQWSIDKMMWRLLRIKLHHENLLFPPTSFSYLRHTHTLYKAHFRTCDQENIDSVIKHTCERNIQIALSNMCIHVCVCVCARAYAFMTCFCFIKLIRIYGIYQQRFL